MKQRLDNQLLNTGKVETRSQAENYIKLGYVSVNNNIVTKPGTFVDDTAHISLLDLETYVSRAGLKIASVKDIFGLDFNGAVVLDVGSSTGGFTDFALKNGAKLVYAVDVGTNQMHPMLRKNPKIKLYEKTDIRDFTKPYQVNLDIITIDVSFISLKEILPCTKKLSNKNTQIIAMCKPQFEATKSQTNKGVIKNSKLRRQILDEFEEWLKTNSFLIVNKADSKVAGTKGNLERFYLLK